MLDYIGLENFKAFDDIELSLGGLTVLSGLNGSGKSTVLQAIGVLRQSFDGNFLLNGELALNGELVEIGTGRDVLYQGFDKLEIAIALSETRQGESISYRWQAPANPDADVLACSARPDRGKLPLLDIFNIGFQFLRADRITPSVTSPKSQNAVRQQRFLGAKGEYTAHFLLEFGEQITTAEIVRSSHEGRAGSLIAQVNAWMQEFSPGVRVEPVPVPMTDLVRLVFSYKGEGAAYGEPLRPTNVGFGLTHALPVITACLAAEPGTVLVVENPEAQLHPRGQASMGRLLALTAANHVQVIVESHSDHVLNGIRLAVKEGLLVPRQAKLHFFSRKPGEPSSYETPELTREGRLSYWPAGFFDQWEKSLDRLLD
jgi:predicted ATPase